jgi:heme/copper-type cytochrome/quinol oxidase subunit 2
MIKVIWVIISVVTFLVFFSLATFLYNYIGSEHWSAHGGGRSLSELKVWEFNLNIVAFILIVSVFWRKGND